MPIYVYENPETGEIVEVIQKMSDKHEYVDDSGVKYRRVFLPANTQIDGDIDELSAKDFVEKTRNKSGTIGDLWDMSKELSEKRKKKHGKDPILQKYYKNYSKERNGMKHDNDK